MRFIHVNLTVTHLERMSAFYQEVFQCVPLADPQTLSGACVEGVTGIPNAVIKYVHLALPGNDGRGRPDLELIEYKSELVATQKDANASGFGHIAFLVDDIDATIQKIVAHRGALVNRVVTYDLPGRGLITECYTTDPEGNIVELQSDEHHN